MMNRGFVSLLASQFCGAMNDNILKQVLIFMVIANGVWAGQLGEGGQGIVSALFTLPFIFLSGYAGTCADRWSKRTVMVLVRGTELPIAVIAGIGFATANLWMTMTAMVLLSCQSAFFGPAKYGLIPELVVGGKLSQANGAINMLTNIAVIAGAVAAGVVSEKYYPKPEAPIVASIAADASAADLDSLADAGLALAGEPATEVGGLSADPADPSAAAAPAAAAGPADGAGPADVPDSADRDVRVGDEAAADGLVDATSAGGDGANAVAATGSPVRPWFPGIVLLVIAVGGLVTALPVPRLPARRPGLPFELNPMSTYMSSIQAMRAGPLLTITLTWGFFYLLAGMALLILPEYHEVLGIDRYYASLLLAILGVAIGIGSVIAGVISGSTIDLRLVPAGAIGIVIFFVLLAVDSTTFLRVSLYISGAGIAAGLYLVPLQAAVQRLAPLADRGRFIGTANAISFVFLLIGSVAYWLVRGRFDHVEHLFAFCAALMVGGIAVWLLLGRAVGRRAVAAMHAAHDEDEDVPRGGGASSPAEASGPPTPVVGTEDDPASSSAGGDARRPSAAPPAKPEAPPSATPPSAPGAPPSATPPSAPDAPPSATPPPSTRPDGDDGATPPP